MKRQGYKDTDIAVKLVDEGFTRYKPQTITSRYARIKKTIQSHNEVLLDEELTDWHAGEVSTQAALLLRPD